VYVSEIMTAEKFVKFIRLINRHGHKIAQYGQISIDLSSLVLKFSSITEFTLYPYIKQKANVHFRDAVNKPLQETASLVIHLTVWAKHSISRNSNHTCSNKDLI